LTFSYSQVWGLEALGRVIPIGVPFYHLGCGAYFFFGANAVCRRVNHQGDLCGTTQVVWGEITTTKEERTGVRPA